MLSSAGFDWRNIQQGSVIPSENYTDQPYMIRTDDGAWLCAVTTGCGHEGQKGQHVITSRSTDCGKNWTDFSELESVDVPESAYAVLLKIPSGRIFAFYNFNADNIRSVPVDPDANGVCHQRVDCLGQFVFRYSDDHGRIWSDERYTIDVREMDIDRENCFGGRVRFFWNVGKAFMHKDRAYVPLIKVGGFGPGCYTRTEGALLECANITSASPEEFKWKTLPDGEAGLRTPKGGGVIAEEQSYSVLSDGSFFVVYRSVDGSSVCSYSRDKGHNWSPPQYMSYADGRRIKHPRAANFAWKLENGKFLYWFHNNGGNGFEHRNPAWLLCGIEDDSPDGKIIKWSQPEIALYDHDPHVGMSYPDVIEENGELYISETQKKIARVHCIDRTFLKKLFGQFENESLTADKCLLDLRDPHMPLFTGLSPMPDFTVRDGSLEHGGTRNLETGITIEFVYTGKELVDTVLLDNRDSSLAGFCVTALRSGAFRITLNDGRTESSWQSDPAWKPGVPCHVGVVLDAGPQVISFINDGKFNDGGSERMFGWGRFNPYLKGINSEERLSLYSGLSLLRIHGRALMTSELVGNYRCWLKQQDTEEISESSVEVEETVGRELSASQA